MTADDSPDSVTAVDVSTDSVAEVDVSASVLVPSLGAGGLGLAGSTGVVVLVGNATPFS